MRAQQAVIVEPLRIEVREAELGVPGANQVLVRTEASAVSAGTELAVYTGTHQWLRDPTLPEWKFPFRPGYSAAGTVVAVGAGVSGWEPGDRVCYPGNHASAEILTLGHERGRLWRLPNQMKADEAAWGCIARYGMGAAIRTGLTLGRSAAVVGLGIIGQFSLRSMIAAGAWPVVGIDGVRMRRAAAAAAGADFVIDPADGPVRQQLDRVLRGQGAEIVADATGIPEALPAAMNLACDGGQVVVVGSPRGRAQQVNFYDDLHRRYLEVSGAHGNMLFEPGGARLTGAWDVDKAQNWLLAAVSTGRISLAGLVTQRVRADQLARAYEGLLNDKEHFLGVVLDWAS